jgi:hypothetical protein
MSVLATALAFVKRGHPVLPLHYPVGTDTLVCSCGRLCGKNAAKHPYGKAVPKGLTSATTESGVVKHWFGYVVPDANLGVVSDKLVVLDVDPRHDGHESLAELEHECELPHTWRALTGGGGVHIIFACPDGVRVASYSPSPGSVPPLGPGIDIRARGGYIVAPPSRHISGRQYSWSPEHHPNETELAVAPEWLLERLTTRSPRAGVEVVPIPSDEWSQITRQTVTEYRDRVAAKIVGHLFRRGCDYELVLGMLQAWNGARCNPPLDDRELTKIVDRIATKEAERIERELSR